MVAWASRVRYRGVFLSADSIIATQRQFRAFFQLGLYGEVSSRMTITMLWVTNFTTTGSSLKKKPTGRQRSAQKTKTFAELIIGLNASEKNYKWRNVFSSGLLHFAWSVGFNCWTLANLYGWKCIPNCKICLTEQSDMFKARGHVNERAYKDWFPQLHKLYRCSLASELTLDGLSASFSTHNMLL